MLHPTTTGLQMAHHDAWLAEMRKEPSPELGRVARPEAEAHRRRELASRLAEIEQEALPEVGLAVGSEAEARTRKGLASRLAGVAKRLWSRRGPAVPTTPESTVQAKGASV